MNLKYVKINEGGKVGMKLSDLYGKEEVAMADEICSIVNADSKLKKLFADAASKIVKEYAVDIIAAFKTKDGVAGQRALQKAIDLLKGLTMHMCVQIMLKKKEAK